MDKTRQRAAKREQTPGAIELGSGNRNPETSESSEPKNSQEETLIQYFVKTCTIQGPGKIKNANNLFQKVMWAVFLLVATGLMIYQLVDKFKQYYRWEIRTDVSLGFTPLALPAVTVCNLNRARLSQASKLSCPLQQTLYVPEDYQNPACRNYGTKKVDNHEEESNNEEEDSYDFYDYFDWGNDTAYDDCCWDNDTAYDDEEGFYDSRSDCYGDCEGNVDNITIQQYRADYGFYKENRTVLENAGHQAKDMILNCNLISRDCDSTDFTPSYSADYGNCYTISIPKRKVSRSGANTGLNLTLNIEAYEYLEPDRAGYGLQVVLHDHGSRPDPSNSGFTVAAGSEVFVGLKLVNITRLGSPYGSCDDGEEYKRSTGSTYTIQGCRNLCLKEAVVRRCSCAPLFDDFANMAKDNYCNNKTERECMDPFIANYYTEVDKGNDTCICSKPCSESVYQTTITSHVWPVIKQLKNLEDVACPRSDNASKCRSYIELGGIKDNGYADYVKYVDNIERRRLSFVRLHVYYDTLNYEILTEKPLKEVVDFLSDIGGLLGLFIGGSVLVIGELFEMVILLLLEFHRNRRVRCPASSTQSTGS